MLIPCHERIHFLQRGFLAPVNLCFPACPHRGEENILQERHSRARLRAALLPTPRDEGKKKPCKTPAWHQHGVWMAHRCELRLQGLGQLPASHLEESPVPTAAAVLPASLKGDSCLSQGGSKLHSLAPGFGTVWCQFG